MGGMGDCYFRYITRKKIIKNKRSEVGGDPPIAATQL
jgi:hypothetical protein